MLKRRPFELVESVSQFLGLVERLTGSDGWAGSRGGHHEIWFRGHANSEWRLRPSAFRESFNDIDWMAPSHEPAEFPGPRRAVRFFTLHSASLLGEYPGPSEFEAELLAQHHSIPTRLLDWSANPLAALYFALRDAVPQDEPEIWVLEPSALNRASLKISDIAVAPPMFMDAEGPVAFLPPNVTPRIAAQSGRFTVHPPMAPDLYSWIDAAVHGGRTDPEALQAPLTSIRVARGVAPRMLQDLRRLNVHEASMFPDLDGLARHTRTLLREGLL